MPGREAEPWWLLPQFSHLQNGKMLPPPASSPVEPSEEAELKPITCLGPLERSTGLT